MTTGLGIQLHNNVKEHSKKKLDQVHILINVSYSIFNEHVSNYFYKLWTEHIFSYLIFLLIFLAFQSFHN